MAADIALAASARDWPDRLHRFLLDHGGGRIVDRLLSAEQTREGSFDVLIIDDVCSFLTPNLVKLLKARGAEVIGVYDPDDGSDAKRRLLECGISDVIESDASPEELLGKIGLTMAHRLPHESPPSELDAPTRTIAVTGPSAGVGMTELSIALSRSLSKRVSTTLLDLDQQWPSIAQRLDLPVHPNIRTALDRVLHSPDRLPTSLHLVDDLAIVGGRADGGRAAPVSRHEVTVLVDALGDSCDVVVADVGPVAVIEGGLLREFDIVIVVGTATPVGLLRLVKTIDHVASLGSRQSLLAVVNQTDRSVFRRGEAVTEFGRVVPEVPLVTLPYDSRLGDAAWNGTIRSGNRYRRAIDSIAELVVGSLQ